MPNSRDFLYSFQSRQRPKEQLCKSVSQLVCLSVIKLSKQLHISSLDLSMLSLCLLVYVRPSGLASSFSSSCQPSHQSMLGHQAQLHLSQALAMLAIYVRPCQSMLGHQDQLHLSLDLDCYLVMLLKYSVTHSETTLKQYLLVDNLLQTKKVVFRI